MESKATFVPDQNELKNFFSAAAKKPEVKEVDKLTILDDDFVAMEDVFRSMSSAYRFTGFNPKEYKEYLMAEVFKKKNFTQTTAMTTISMLISLFITRGNKMTKKNLQRMDEAGKSAIEFLGKTLGPDFKLLYDPKDLTDKTITPARVAASFPIVTTRMLEVTDGRVVGTPPEGLPKGLCTSLAFSIVPQKCVHLKRAIAIWRDSFTLVINPKAVSDRAQWYAKASAANFSELAYRSDFVKESERIKAVGVIATLALAKFKGKERDPTIALKTLCLYYWVDLPEFVNSVFSEMSPSRSTKGDAVQFLTDLGYDSDFIKQLPTHNLTKFYDLLKELYSLLTPDQKEEYFAIIETFAVDTLDFEDVAAVGTMGASDQGESFEKKAMKELESEVQPGRVPRLKVKVVGRPVKKTTAEISKEIKPITKRGVRTPKSPPKETEREEESE
jgi:hypothetical protein